MNSASKLNVQVTVVMCVIGPNASIHMSGKCEHYNDERVKN